ncbi:dephospho-CoA kinase [Candidatus Pelagibacter sp. FZCC0015]|uniref:dephospho-CoA kinase n=1 Tax=Candidatus Pelagibacter sp. FZCC0015 TaxID=2268451 RepID=UPI00119F58F3|nr:dephospho-CoA kinase [Candidatus Pelagibacter sp. FZCC0015]
MIRIGILGNIGSGKSYVAKNFGYPVFNADYEVSKLYKKDKKIFKKLKKKLPKYISSFPINKNEITKAILSNKVNLKKIITIVHLEIRKILKLFLKKNRNKKVIILDIPLLLENKINNKDDILVFVDSKKIEIEKRLKKRLNFNRKLINKFKKIQFSSSYKKRRSNFIIKNNFKKKSLNKSINKILNEIL